MPNHLRGGGGQIPPPPGDAELLSKPVRGGGGRRTGHRAARHGGCQRRRWQGSQNRCGRRMALRAGDVTLCVGGGGGRLGCGEVVASSARPPQMRGGDAQGPPAMHSAPPPPPGPPPTTHGAQRWVGCARGGGGVAVPPPPTRPRPGPSARSSHTGAEAAPRDPFRRVPCSKGRGRFCCCKKEKDRGVCVARTELSNASGTWHVYQWGAGQGRDALDASRAPSLCPATVPLTPSASLNGICNRQ